MVKDFVSASGKDWQQNRFNFDSKKYDKIYLKIQPGEDVTYIDNIYFNTVSEFNIFGNGDFETGDLSVLGTEINDYFGIATDDGENDLAHSGIYSFKLSGGGFADLPALPEISERARVLTFRLPAPQRNWGSFYKVQAVFPLRYRTPVHRDFQSRM